MALLLAFYQKMRLIREKNKLSMDLVGITSKKSRIEKNIKNREKFYTSIMEQLKNQATAMQNSFGIGLRNQMHLGCNDFGNIWSGNCINGYVIDQLTSVVNTKDDNNKLYGKDVNKLLTEYNNPNIAKTEDGKIDYAKTEFGSEEAYKQFTNSISTAQMNQTQMSHFIQSQTDNYKNQVSVWQQAHEEAIEAAKDEELGQLSYKETMIDLDKTAIEQRLEEIKAEIESYDSLLKEETKNAAPKFGL